MQRAIAREPLNTQLWITTFSFVVATVGGLLSDVLASHLTPALTNRTPLAIVLYVVLLLAGLLLTIRKEHHAWLPLSALVPSLDRATREELESILLPLMQDGQDRRALLGLALGESPIYDRIEFEGAAEPFTLGMIDTLVQQGEVAPGKEALWALLEVVNERVGSDQQDRIRALQPAIAALSRRRTALARRRFLRLPQAFAGRLKPLPIAVFLVLALLVAFGSPLVTTVYARNVQYCLPDRICVLVARFEPEGGEAASDFTEAIYDQLDQLLIVATQEHYTLHRVSLTEEGREGETDEQTVRRLARERGASLVVWGAVHENRGSQPVAEVRFYSADPMGVSEASATQPFRAEPLRYSTLSQMYEDCLVIEASGHAPIVAYAMSGLLHYVRHRPREARLAFEAALYCAGELDEAAGQGDAPSCAPGEPASDWNPGLLYYYRGKAYFLEGDFRNAIANLEAAAKNNPDDPAALIGVGAAYQGWLGAGYEDNPLASDAFDEAARRATALLKSASAGTAAAVWYDLGFIHELRREYSEARDDYGLAVHQIDTAELRKQAKSPYVALMALARVQQKAGDLAAARASLQRAMDEDPSLSWAYIGMAQSYENNMPTAQRWLDKAKQSVDVFDAAADVAEAQLCKQWQDYECATEAFRNALKKWPQAGNLHGLAGDFYRQLGDWEAARTHYRIAAEQLRPDDPWAHERLAFVLFQQGQFEQSREEYESAIARAYAPEYAPDLYCALGLARDKAGQTRAALESYERCVELSEDSERKTAAEGRIEQLGRGLAHPE